MCGVVSDTTSFRTTQEVWIVKLDASGSLLWQHGTGGTEEEGVPARHAVAEGPSGRLYVLAQTQSFELGTGPVWPPSSGGRDTWVLCLAAHGELIWQKVVDGPGHNGGISMTATDDLVVLAGQADWPPLTNTWTAALSSEGDGLWQKVLLGGHCDSAMAIAPRPGGGFYLAGGNSSDTSTDFLYRMWFGAMDEDGNLEWSRTIQHRYFLAAYDLATLPDGILLVGGGGEGGVHELDEAVVARLNRDGSFTGDCDLVAPGTFSVEDSTFTIRDTAATLRATDGVLQEAHSTFTAVDVRHGYICP